MILVFAEHLANKISREQELLTAQKDLGGGQHADDMEAQSKR